MLHYCAVSRGLREATLFVLRVGGLETGWKISPVELYLSSVSTGLIWGQSKIRQRLQLLEELGQSSFCKDTCGKQITHAFAQVREYGTGV